MTPDEARRYARLVVDEIRPSERTRSPAARRTTCGHGSHNPLRARAAVRRARAGGRRWPGRDLRGRAEADARGRRRPPARHPRQRDGLIGSTADVAPHVTAPPAEHWRRCVAVRHRVSRAGQRDRMLAARGRVRTAGGRRRHAGLVPTAHPAIPATWAETWLVPEPGSRPSDAWRSSRKACGCTRPAASRARWRRSTIGRLASTPLAGYARYYAGTVRPATAAARRRAGSLRRRPAPPRAAATRCSPSSRGWPSPNSPNRRVTSPRRRTHYEFVLTRTTPGRPGPRAVRPRPFGARRRRSRPRRSPRRCGSTTSSRRAPRTSAAAELVAELRGCRPTRPRTDEFFKRDLARGERLFAARLWDDARDTFEGLRSRASGDDARGGRPAHRRVRPDDRASPRRRRSARAVPRHGVASGRGPLLLPAGTARGGEHRRLRPPRVGAADDFPTVRGRPRRSTTSRRTYIVARRGRRGAGRVRARAANSSRPSRHAERAAWKLGWSHYRHGRASREAADVFERGAANAPRSDYRPAWLYWAGRARERAGDRATARGPLPGGADRLPATRTTGACRRRRCRRSAWRSIRPLAAAAPPSTGPRLRRPAPVVASTGARSAQRRADRALAGPRPVRPRRERRCSSRSGRGAPRRPLDATLAWIYSREGDLRKGIGLMRRAYPQFLTGGRRAPAGRPAAGDLPAGLLAADPPQRRGTRRRPVPRGGARRAGVDVPGRRPVGRERLGADADRAGHGPATREGRGPAHGSAPSQLTDPDDQRAARHALPRGPAGRLRRRRTSRWPATTPASRASFGGGPSGPGGPARTSSTTSRSPKRRTT